MSILGYDFDHDKDREPTSAPDYLGATLLFAGDSVIVRPKAERLQHLCEDVWSLIRNGCGRAQNLASIRGRLLHVLDCARGRVGGNIMPRLAHAVNEGHHELCTDAREELKACRLPCPAGFGHRLPSSAGFGRRLPSPAGFG